MNWIPFPQKLREGLLGSFVSTRKLALLFLMTLTAQSHAQDIFAFKDKDQLANAMLTLAARTARNVEVPDPCRLHVVVIAGGRELFAGPTFDTMHHTMARGLIGEAGVAACGLQLHELAGKRSSRPSRRSGNRTRAKYAYCVFPTARGPPPRTRSSPAQGPPMSPGC